MIDVKLCDGCYNDFYNQGSNGMGGKGCWSRESATMVPRLLIPIDLAPPYKMKPQSVPSCYKRQRFATVKPESLDAQGYWKS